MRHERNHNSANCLPAELQSEGHASSMRATLSNIAIAAWRSAFFMLAALAFCFGIGASAQPPTDDSGGPDAAARFIEALANHNEPPRLAKDAFSINHVCEPPIFGERYDWGEQERVLKVLYFLAQGRGEALWPHLVEHLNDKRYSLTCHIEGYGCNLTIGSICWKMVRQDLTQPYNQLWPRSGLLCGWDALEFARPYGTIDEWQRLWKDKQLWELQVELGEWGIKRLEGASETPAGLGWRGIVGGGMGGASKPLRNGGMGMGHGPRSGQGERGIPGTESFRKTPTKEEAELIQKTKAIIDGIRKTKKPIVDNTHKYGPYGEGARFFTEQEAKKIREEYLIRLSIGAVSKPTTKSEKGELIYLGKALDEWIALTKHKDGKIRVYAAHVLWEAYPATESTIPPLLAQLLEDKEPSFAAFTPSASPTATDSGGRSSSSRSRRFCAAATCMKASPACDARIAGTRCSWRFRASSVARVRRAIRNARC